MEPALPSIYKKGAKEDIPNAQPPHTTKTMYNIYFVGV
jgi:hypothetical protein